MSKALHLSMRLLKAASIALTLAFVAIAIILSDGRVLDLSIGMSQAKPILVILSVICYLSSLAAIYMFVAGGWRQHVTLKRSLLTGLLAIPIVLATKSLVEPHAPEWLLAISIFVAGGAAAIIATRIVPDVDDHGRVQRL